MIRNLLNDYGVNGESIDSLHNKLGSYMRFRVAS